MSQEPQFYDGVCQVCSLKGSALQTEQGQVCLSCHASPPDSRPCTPYGPVAPQSSDQPGLIARSPIDNDEFKQVKH